MFCKKCGKEVKVSESFCRNCGNDLRTEGILETKYNDEPKSQWIKDLKDKWDGKSAKGPSSGGAQARIAVPTPSNPTSQGGAKFAPPMPPNPSFQGRAQVVIPPDPKPPLLKPQARVSTAKGSNRDLESQDLSEKSNEEEEQCRVRFRDTTASDMIRIINQRKNVKIEELRGLVFSSPHVTGNDDYLPKMKKTEFIYEK